MIDTRAQPQNGTQEGFFPSSRLPLEKEGSRKTARIHIDANGNLTNDGNGKTYTFDAANRMVSCTQTVNSVQTVTGFVYDGFGRRVQQTSNGTLVKQWVWCGGAQPCEERDANNNVTKRFYSQGEQINGTNYYYTFDHLGSVREMTNSAGSLIARYDYDPFGRRTLVSGTDLADFGFTGFYHDQATNLDYSRTRPYTADLARWIGQDPIGEAGGINLYEYVRNDPINLTDPLGLWVPPSSNHNVDPGVHLNAGEFLGAVGSGAWSGLTGASGKGMAQTAVGVGAAWSGVATMNPYAVVGGVGLIGIGLTNYFGGLFEGPDFKGPPLLPDMDVETWKAWNEARKRQEQKDQEDCKHKKTRQFTIHFFNGDPNDPNTTETGAVKFVY